VVGDAEVRIEQVGSLEHAGSRQIAFLSGPRHKAKLAGTRAGAVVLSVECAGLTALPRIVCGDPYPYFARVAQMMNPAPLVAPGRHASASIDPAARVAASARIEAGAVVAAGAEIGDRAWIGEGCYLGAGAVVGADSRLYPSVVLYAGCRIGARAIVHSGAVIGADGFGMAREDGRWLKIPQIGRVLIGDDVEIGANTTIDRGTLDDTVIEDGVKLDNQIQIGHNCHIGAHTAMAGCAGVAGSTRIGQRCMIGGAAAILGHLEICDDVVVSTMTVVSRSIRKPGTYTGFYPSDEHTSWARNAALVRHLEELAGRLKALENTRGKRRKKRDG
jgi:UDP-3-O-[3-hydroxymyristoyl] glucosamine N-acyltransferase